MILLSVSIILLIWGATLVSAGCDLPSTYRWSSSGVLAQPKTEWVSLKDFTHAIYNGQHLVIATTHDHGTKYGSMQFGLFRNWSDMATAPQIGHAGGMGAPTLFYFSPKKIWILAYQWGATKFSYKTSTNPSNANGWGAPQNLYNGDPVGGGTGPIDQTLIG